MVMPEERSYYQHYMSFCGNIVQSCHEGMACFGGQDNWRLHQNFELMQFTGLHDKNGVEIYEGDIIDWQGGIFYIKWEDSDASFFAVEQYDSFAESGQEWSGACAVVGNIHQHPELLK